MKNIVTMGEIMLRLMPRGNLRVEQAPAFDAYYGGDEAIVAASLARLGLNAWYVTKLPDNPLGRAALQNLRAQGINTEYVAIGGDRLGLNFYENGAAMRPSKVYYDRQGSAIAQAKLGDFDLERIFKDKDWFHVSGITPALSDSTAEITEQALATAKKLGVTVSVDLNYRRKLWSPEKAKRIMTKLMSYVDVCIGNEEDAEIALGFAPKNTDVFSGKINIEGYKEIFTQMVDQFGFKYVASTLRESYSASVNGWSALVYDGKGFHHSKKYEITLVDRGGGGASFSAGLIYGLLTGMTLAEATEFAAASSALKQTIRGDFNLTSLNDIEQLLGGDASGRVQR
jgi:2-dehydro-3-deoxygluconokinase